LQQQMLEDGENRLLWREKPALHIPSSPLARKRKHHCCYHYAAL